MGSLAYLRMAQGRLREADASLRQALAFAANEGRATARRGTRAYRDGELHYERDELDPSERELTLVRAGERAGELEILVRDTWPSRGQDGHEAIQNRLKLAYRRSG